MSQQQQPPNFLENMKKASQRFGSTLVDAGAKTMLKTDMVFLERDIKSRKHQFGILIYEMLSTNSSVSVSAPEIQKAFDECQAEILKLEVKLTAKQDEMRAIDRHGGGGGGGGIGCGSMNSTPGETVEMEYGGEQSP